MDKRLADLVTVTEEVHALRRALTAAAATRAKLAAELYRDGVRNAVLAKVMGVTTGRVTQIIANG